MAKGNVKTTKQYSIPGCGFTDNGYKTTNGKDTGRGSTPQKSHDNFVKNSSKGKK